METPRYGRIPFPEPSALPAAKMSPGSRIYLQSAEREGRPPPRPLSLNASRGQLLPMRNGPPEMRLNESARDRGTEPPAWRDGHCNPPPPDPSRKRESPGDAAPLPGCRHRLLSREVTGSDCESYGHSQRASGTCDRSSPPPDARSSHAPGFLEIREVEQEQAF